MIERASHVLRVLDRLRTYPAVAVLGARQVGKSTLARQIAAAAGCPTAVFDLERPADVGRLEDAETALTGLSGLVVLDEIHRRPDLFPVLRVLADRDPLPARFLILGSASPSLLRQTSETLAGRIHHYDLPGFTIDEVGGADAERLWIRGVFPRAFVSASDAEAAIWREDYIRTFVERDLPQLGIGVPAPTMRRFSTMLAHSSGQTWNGSDTGRSLGVSDRTARAYLDHLAATYLVRLLPAWHENLSARQVRAPKVHFTDSGLLHSFFGLVTKEDVLGHPRAGASFEGFALGQVIVRLGARADEVFHWRTQQGAEIDLLVVRGRRRVGFEVKMSVAPTVTKSMRVALDALRLDRLDVVHLGTETYPLGDRIRAVAVRRVFEDVEPLS